MAPRKIKSLVSATHNIAFTLRIHVHCPVWVTDLKSEVFLKDLYSAPHFITYIMICPYQTIAIELSQLLFFLSLGYFYKVHSLKSTFPSPTTRPPVQRCPRQTATKSSSQVCVKITKKTLVFVLTRSSKVTSIQCNFLPTKTFVDFPGWKDQISQLARIWCIKFT